MQKTIITISRQFGAGGRELGKKLAGQLNIPYYDKELLSKAAKNSALRALWHATRFLLKKQKRKCTE